MMEADKAYDLNTISDPFVGKGRVYFTMNSVEEGANRSSVYSFDGKNVEKVTKGNLDRLPQIAGDKLYYVISDGKKDKLVVAGQNPDAPETLFEFKKIYKYVVSGKRIAAIVEEETQEKPIFTTTRVKYRSDGRGLLLSRKKIIICEDGKVSTAVSGDYDVFDFAISGDRIVFAASKENDDLDLSLQDTYTYDIASGEMEKITKGEGSSKLVAFGNDGEIAYVGHREGRELYQPDRLIMHPSGMEVFLGKDIDMVYSDVFPGGKNQLMWENGAYYTIAETGGDTHLYSYNGSVEKLTGDSVSIREFHVSGKNVAYIWSSIEKPNVLNFNGAEYDPNPDFKGTSAELNTVSGVEYWAMITGKDNPTVLFVHGGPHNAYGNVYFTEMDYTAKNGFNVLFANPTGSKGYGVEFAKGCIGDWGGKDFRELLSVIDHAKAKYGLKENFHITGLSYGGFMTNWAITHSDRFKSAVSEASVSNLISMCGTSDIAFWFNAVESDVADPWSEEGMKKLAEQSPVYYAKRVTTPTMFMHGENDYRCPIEQSEQMYTAIRLNGVETVLARVAGASHPFLRNSPPSVKSERLVMKLDWYRKHS